MNHGLHGKTGTPEKSLGFIRDHLCNPWLNWQKDGLIAGLP